MDNRWEHCPECLDGWPNYIGLTKDKNFHEFVCTVDDCELYYRVPVGKGQFDQRLGMELDPKVIYYETCDGCRRPKPVKVVDLRFLCKKCGEDGK
jgi:hypothetical protein